MQRRVLAPGLLALGVSVMGYALFSPGSDEERVRRTLLDLAEAVSFSEPIQNPVFYASHLNEEFEDLLTERVAVSLAEVSSRMPEERHELGLAAAQVLSRSGSLSVTLDFEEIRIDDTGADAEVSATVLADRGGLRRETRSVRFRLLRDGRAFRVSQVIVGAAE